MEFNDYQNKCKETAEYPIIGHGCVYPALGLANEAGECLGKIKKVFRDNDGVFSNDKVEAIKAEAGDILWYLSQLCTELGISLNDVAQLNLDKLIDRKVRGVIQGSGDNR